MQASMPVPRPSALSAAKMFEATVLMPEKFKQMVRRAQKQLTKEMNPKLLQAFNQFFKKLNIGKPEADLEELGDELADIFDEVWAYTAGCN